MVTFDARPEIYVVWGFVVSNRSKQSKLKHGWIVHHRYHALGE